jgi:hypothetical protein
VWDLGAGDGKIAIMAAKKFGARATGIEYNPDMVKHANANAQAAGVSGTGKGQAQIRHGDIFQTDFSQATVITLYLLPALNMKLRPTLLSMRPGTRVVSHSFSMEDWEADEISTLDGRRAYFWLVPANVMGTWTLELGSQKTDMALEQRFQHVTGSLSLGPIHAGLRDARLRGTAITSPTSTRRGCAATSPAASTATAWKAPSATRRAAKESGARLRSSRLHRPCQAPPPSVELAKRVFLPRKVRWTVPIGPFRCLPMITSARPFASSLSGA